MPVFETEVMLNAQFASCSVKLLGHPVSGDIVYYMSHFMWIMEIDLRINSMKYEFQIVFKLQSLNTD